MTFMSSGHNPDRIEVVQRKRHDGSTIDVDCPICAVDYNQFMGVGGGHIQTVLPHACKVTNIQNNTVYV